MNTRTDERTHYEAVGDIAYCCRYYLMQERLFGKLAGLFRLVTLVAGSAAFAGFIAKNNELAAFSALTTAIITALDIVIDPGSRKYTCNEAQRRYRELERQAPRLLLPELDERLVEMRSFSAPSIEALRKPAYNSACEERSRPDAKLKIGPWEWFVSKLA